ncbi:hypothetical protein [Oculatella sp. LEGE 06141]
MQCNVFGAGIALLPCLWSISIASNKAWIALPQHLKRCGNHYA